MTAASEPSPRYARDGVRRFTVQDLLDRGLIRPGSLLRPVRKALPVFATVGGSGEIIVKGVAHKTPSGAARAASGHPVESGWRFWVTDDGESLADLRIRLRALDRSRSPINERFEAWIGGWPPISYSVEADGRLCSWRHSYAGEPEEEHVFAPTAEEWVRFWDAVDRVGIWHWDENYEIESQDGTSWHVVAERDWKRVESSGHNGYPETFDAFCRAISKLCQRAFR
ncbi:MAG: hypothetical protein M3R39_07980 [Actinomycetota bacterium]|nr:hypothetical protein [Actinomycetota bacterium]